MKTPLRIASLLALSLLSGAAARATDYVWNSAAASSYTTAASWLVGGVAPTAAPSAAVSSTVNIVTPVQFGDMFIPSTYSAEEFDAALSTAWTVRTSSTAGTLSVLDTLTKDGAAALTFRSNSGTVLLTLNAVNIQATAGTLNLGSASSSLRLGGLTVTGTTTVNNGATVNVYSTASGNPTFSTISTAGTFNALGTVATGAVTVASGGVLAGNGQVAASSGNGVTVQSGGVVSAGSAGTGTLVLDGANTSSALLTMQAGASFAFTLGSGNTSTLLSLYNYAGASDLALNNTTFNFTGAQAGTYKLFTFYSDSGTTLAADGIASGFDLADSTGLAGFNATLQYNASNITLVLTAAPEPSSLVLMAAALAACLGWRRGRESVVRA